MYSVSFLFKGSDLAIGQYFKTFKNAEEAYKKAFACMRPESADMFFVSEDDFDSRVSVQSNQLSAVSFTDIEKDLDKNYQIQMMQQSQMQKGQHSKSKLLTSASPLTIAQ